MWHADSHFPLSDVDDFLHHQMRSFLIPEDWGDGSWHVRYCLIFVRTHPPKNPVLCHDAQQLEVPCEITPSQALVTLRLPKAILRQPSANEWNVLEENTCQSLRNQWGIQLACQRDGKSGLTVLTTQDGLVQDLQVVDADARPVLQMTTRNAWVLVENPRLPLSLALRFYQSRPEKHQITLQTSIPHSASLGGVLP
jgi:hypothetical protein